MKPKLMRYFIIATAALVLLLPAQDSMAHTKQPGGGWYFRGQTFDDGDAGRAGQRSARKDPVNVIWYGGTHHYSTSAVENHLDNHWDASKVGGSGWRKHDEILSLCKQDQIMVWRGLPGRDADKTDRHGSTARNRYICGSQHHTRLWDDYEHDKLAGAAHDRYQWVVGGIHYDKVGILRPTANCPPSAPVTACTAGVKKVPNHIPGRSWNVARHQMRRALHGLCGERAWKLHTGAQGWFQGFYSTGYLARMTLREKSQGCAGSGP